MDNKIIVMFSGEGTTLQALIDNCKSVDIIATITDNPNANGIKRSEAAGIPCFVVERESQSKSGYNARLVETIQQCGLPRFIVLAGYMKILSEYFIHHFNSRGVKIINIHPSILPKYKGLHTHQRALDEGAEYHGMTIHVVVPEVDSGEIIHQSGFAVQLDDTVESLEAKVKKLEQQFYPIVIDMLCER